jgi:hypothetical protein
MAPMTPPCPSNLFKSSSTLFFQLPPCLRRFWGIASIRVNLRYVNDYYFLIIIFIRNKVFYRTQEFL